VPHLPRRAGLHHQLCPPTRPPAVPRRPAAARHLRHSVRSTPAHGRRSARPSWQPPPPPAVLLAPALLAPARLGLVVAQRRPRTGSALTRRRGRSRRLRPCVTSRRGWLSSRVRVPPVSVRRPPRRCALLRRWTRAQLLLTSMLAYTRFRLFYGRQKPRALRHSSAGLKCRHHCCLRPSISQNRPVQVTSTHAWAA